MGSTQTPQLVLLVRLYLAFQVTYFATTLALSRHSRLQTTSTTLPTDTPAAIPFSSSGIVWLLPSYDYEKVTVFQSPLTGSHQSSTGGGWSVQAQAFDPANTASNVSYLFYDEQLEMFTTQLGPIVVDPLTGLISSVEPFYDSDSYADVEVTVLLYSGSCCSSFSFMDDPSCCAISKQHLIIDVIVDSGEGVSTSTRIRLGVIIGGTLLAVLVLVICAALACRRWMRIARHRSRGPGTSTLVTPSVEGAARYNNAYVPDVSNNPGGVAGGVLALPPPYAAAGDLPNYELACVVPTAPAPTAPQGNGTVTGAKDREEDGDLPPAYAEKQL